LVSEIKIFSAIDIEANSFIAKSCLLYILYDDKSDSKAIFSDDLKYFPVLQYAYEFWYIHIKLILMENQKSINFIIFRLFLSHIILIA
jgi:hypothetical protein